MGVATPTREGPLGPPLVIVEVRVSAEDGEEGVREGAALQEWVYLYDVHLPNCIFSSADPLPNLLRSNADVI